MHASTATRSRPALLLRIACALALSGCVDAATNDDATEPNASETSAGEESARDATEPETETADVPAPAREVPPDPSPEPVPTPSCDEALARSHAGDDRHCEALPGGRYLTLTVDEPEGDPANGLALHAALYEGLEAVHQLDQDFFENVPEDLHWIVGGAAEVVFSVRRLGFEERAIYRVDERILYIEEEEPVDSQTVTIVLEVRARDVRVLWSGPTDGRRNGLEERCERQEEVSFDLRGETLVVARRSGRCPRLGRARITRVPLPND